MPHRASLAILVASLALFLGACGGGPDAELPTIVSATATRFIGQEGALDASIVRVTFDRDVEPLTGGLPFPSNIELLVPVPDPFTGEDREDRVFVQDAAVVATNPRLVELTILRAIPDGATLVIAGRAFVEDSDATLMVSVQAELTPLAAFLAATPLASTNPALFQAASPPVSEADRDPAVQRDALTLHLNGRGATASVLARALDTFDTIPPEVVASPKLRAALAALTGTFAEPAITDLLTPANCTGLPAFRVAFEPPPELPELFARVTHTEEGARIVSIRPDLEGERIEHLMPLLAHEPIHCDSVDGRFEEVAATAFDTYLYINLLASDATLASAGTPLARELNLDVIAAINSGARFPESFGVLGTAYFEFALPGTTSDAASFGDLVIAAYPTIQFNQSPPEPLAEAYAARLAEAVGIEPGPAFDLLFLDELLAAATSFDIIVAAAHALELQPYRP